LGGQDEKALRVESKNKQSGGGELAKTYQGPGAKSSSIHWKKSKHFGW